MQVDPRTVHRRIAKMQAAGFIRREERRIPGKGSKTNVYHLDGLIAHAAPFAQEKIEEIAARAVEKAQRVNRKRSTIKLVTSKDDEG